MSDARNWGTHLTSFLEIGGSTIIPIPDRVNTHVALTAETFEIFRQGKYLVIEGETGNHRMRVGTLDRRTVTFDAAQDTLTFGSAHPYETGDGPLRIDAAVKVTGTATLTYGQGTSPDRLILDSGDWITQGFPSSGTITVSGFGIGSLNAVYTYSAYATSINPNDALVLAVDGGVGQANQLARVILGTEPGGVAAVTDYWVIKVSATVIKLATSPLNASLGVAADITSAPTGTWEIGGNQGARERVGFAPGTPVTSTDGESNKLLRPAEQVIVSAKSVTLRSSNAADVVKWWSVG